MGQLPKEVHCGGVQDIWGEMSQVRGLEGIVGLVPDIL